MATGGLSGQVCPLCNARVEGGDQLQLHYLTSCSGYDHGGSGGGVASSSHVRDPSPPARATPSGATSGGGAPGNMCPVQFMWQPLTQMSYSKVTLLTSFEPGSVDLSIDPEGGHYYSEQVSIPSGKYEGQLVVGDSFIYPVKEFAVDTESGGIVVLEFDIGAGKGDYFGTGGGANEGDMVMQQNPSFRQSHGYDGGLGGRGGHVTYQDRGSPYHQRRGKTGTAAGGDNLSFREQFRDDYNLQSRAAMNDLSVRRFTEPALSTGDSSSHTDAYSRQLSNEGFDPATVKLKGAKVSHSPDNSLDSAATGTPGAVFVSGAVGGGSSAVGGTQTDKYVPTSVSEGGWEMTSGSGSSREKTMAESGGRGVGRGEGAGGRGVGRGEGAGGRGVERGEGAGGGGEFNEFAQPRPGQDRDRQNDGFSVDSIHHHRSSEDTLRNYEEQLADLRQQLTKVTEEKDSLRQDRERVSAQWEGKVQRLQRKLKQLQGEGEEEPTAEDTRLEEIEEMKSRLDILGAQVDSLSTKLEEKDREMVFQEGQLKEMKNMNAALENQLTEYMDALEHQNKSVQRSMATRQNNSAELAKAEQESARMAEYIRKQQMEYQEALQSLQKKVGLVDEMQQENLKIHQLNLTLTGELEDYRHQTKRLLTDLRQKEEEIATLKLSRSQFGSSDRSQLELESMRQKCDAWREEVEKLSPLRDEVAQLHQENARLKQELALVSEDNTGLARQLQEMSGASGRVGGLERKASEYDQLMERVTELQQVRVQLENELTPLRAERANILSENAALREGSQPEKYLQLKTNFAKLSEECVQLQKCLTDESTESEQLRKRLAEESAINRRMEEVNRQLQQQLEEATDEKGLQAIRERMERYRQERETFRLTVAQLQNELQVHRVKEQENQKDTVVGLRSPQEQEGVWEKQLDQLAHQLEESNKRMHRYREERNTARILNKSLEEQINTLQSTVQQLQSSRAYDSLASAAFDASMVSQLQLQDNSPLQHDLSPSPHEEQVEPYSPDAYSDPPSTMHSRSGSAARKTVKQVSAGGASSGVNYKQRFASASTSSSSVSPRGQVYADVTMKDGVARNILIEKPLYKLNARQKPEVIVKRKAGSYEMGVLSYLGVLDGKEMAGVTLHFPGGNNDGVFKDGKYYFRCTPNHGIYCPLSNIFVEATV